MNKEKDMEEKKQRIDYLCKFCNSDIAVNLLGVGMIKEAEKTIDTDRYKSINLVDFLKEQTEIGIKEKTHINYKIYNEDTGEMKIIIDRCFIDYERKRYADKLKRFLYQFRKPF